MADATLKPTGDVFGKRYGEVLLVHVGESVPEAAVYNTFPLNDCPDELWSKLDCQTVDNNLSLDDLPGLTTRLKLSDAWSYETRTRTRPLRVDTSMCKAHVTQDDFANSYSLQSL